MNHTPTTLSFLTCKIKTFSLTVLPWHNFQTKLWRTFRSDVGYSVLDLYCRENLHSLSTNLFSLLLSLLISCLPPACLYTKGYTNKTNAGFRGLKKKASERKCIFASFGESYTHVRMVGSYKDLFLHSVHASYSFAYQMFHSPIKWRVNRSVLHFIQYIASM